MDGQWKQLLLTLSKHLEEKNIKHLVLLQGIPARDAELISNNSLKLLQYLEQSNKIHPENPDALLKMLSSIERNDLKKYVKTFMTNRGISTDVADTGMKVHHPDYIIKGSPCGICLIISNEVFPPKNGRNFNRYGTLVDEKSLEDTFNWLGFAVDLRKNCTRDQILQALKDVASKDHRMYTAFVCCILTHGDKGEVYGTDWKPVQLVEIKKLFEEGICKSLSGKPKIYFIQACRGDGQDFGFLKPPVESSDQTSQPSDEQDVGQNFDDFHTEAEADVKANAVRDPAAHRKAVCRTNFYFVFPSAQGHKAILDKTKGSWLISSICSVLQQEAQTLNLRDMMVKVNDKISDMESNLRGRYKAIPEIEDNLDFENVYFMPSMSYRKYCISEGEVLPRDNGANE